MLACVSVYLSGSRHTCLMFCWCACGRADDVVKTKQEHLAALAHKFVLGVKDVENDSLDTFLKRVLADSIMLTGTFALLRVS